MTDTVWEADTKAAFVLGGLRAVVAIARREHADVKRLRKLLQDGLYFREGSVEASAWADRVEIAFSDIEEQ